MNNETNQQKGENRRDAYEIYGWGLRALIAALVLDFIAMLNIYWGYWYINVLIGLLIIVVSVFVIRKGITNQVLVCPQCGKFIWSNKSSCCKKCGNEIF